MKLPGLNKPYLFIYLLYPRCIVCHLLDSTRSRSTIGLIPHDSQIEDTESILQSNLLL